MGEKWWSQRRFEGSAQELEFSSKTRKKDQSGLLLPGQIAELKGLKASTYKAQEEYESAFRFLIMQNQEAFPPTGPRMIEGCDLWTSQFAFRVTGLQEEEHSTETKHKIQKSTEMLGALATSANVAAQLMEDPCKLAPRRSVDRASRAHRMIC